MCRGILGAIDKKRPDNYTLFSACTTLSMRLIFRPNFAIIVIANESQTICPMTTMLDYVSVSFVINIKSYVSKNLSFSSCVVLNHELKLLISCLFVRNLIRILKYRRLFLNRNFQRAKGIYFLVYCMSSFFRG